MIYLCVPPPLFQKKKIKTVQKPNYVVVHSLWARSRRVGRTGAHVDQGVAPVLVYCRTRTPTRSASHIVVGVRGRWGVFSSSFAYFATDFFMNISSFDRAHVIHHAVSLILLTAGPLLLPPETLRLSTGWLVMLELGSSGISLTDITGGRFRTLRFLIYCCTRVIVIADTAFVFVTHRDTPTMLCCMASLPLIAHNVCVMNHLWRGMRKRKKN